MNVFLYLFSAKKSTNIPTLTRMQNYNKKSERPNFSLQNLFNDLKLVVKSSLIEDNRCKIHVHSRRKTAICPHCKKRSHSVHSHYIRTLHDLPILNYQTVIVLHARRFRCCNPNCSAKTFAESPCDEIKRYKRNTQRLMQKFVSIAASVSTLEAEKIFSQYDQKISDTTILRYLHQVQVPKCEDIHKVGVDDWAYRKGILYGTIIIDLETGRFVGLLDGREKEPLLEWLKEHLLVNTVSRDRATAFSAAVEEASPFIMQIADRFHLVKNMSDCLVKTLQDMHFDYQRVIREMRMNDYKKLHPNKTDPEELDLYYDRVYYDYFVNKLNLTQICKQLQQEGMRFTQKEFCGKYRYLKQLRNKVRLKIGVKPPAPVLPMYTPIVLAILVERHIHGKAITECAQRLIEKLIKYKWFKELYNATKGFFAFIRERDSAILGDWIKQYLHSSLSGLRTLAKGLEMDIDAVSNALKHNFSNGIVEGYVNKLKALKRTMYGRASVKLLEIKMYLTEKHCTKFE